MNIILCGNFVCTNMTKKSCPYTRNNCQTSLYFIIKNFYTEI